MLRASVLHLFLVKLTSDRAGKPPLHVAHCFPNCPPHSMRLHLLGSLSLACISAQAAAQSTPPVRPLGAVVRAYTGDQLGSVSYVRPLPNGDAIVHDLTRRQVVLLDSKLALKAVVAAAKAAVGGCTSELAGLIPYRSSAPTSSAV